MLLELEHLDVAYGESLILRDVALHVPPGQVVCLMGRNGVGKTTLLKSVIGLLSPRAGTIHFDGDDITALPPARRARRGIGYVPQGREIFPYLTVLENLHIGLMGRQGTEAQALDEVLRLFPALQRLLGRKGGVLSGGEQQQLAIARALVAAPKLLLLDEPTEGIQPSIITEIEDVIVHIKARRDMAILLVEQYLEFAWRLADAYYIMDKGAIVAHGQMSELTEATISSHLTV
jgi:urea transport system ATP-binding protein